MREQWSCQKEKQSKVKMISQGTAAETALRTTQKGGKRGRRWSHDLGVLRVITQRKVKNKETSAEFQGEMNKPQNMFGPVSSGNKEEPLWSKSGRISVSELWGGHSGGASQEKRRHNRGKYSGSQNTQMGHRQSRPNLADWFSFFGFCSAALPAGVYRARSQTSAKSNKK